MSLGGIFEVAKQEREIARLEREIADPSFWQTEQQVETLQNLSALKEHLAEWTALLSALEEAVALSQLLEEEDDTETEHELEENLDELGRALTAYRTRCLLSGSQDRANAILSIHPGAGGTDSCDWAAMLLRMYTNWAQAKGFKAQLVEWAPGEEAGLKTATLLIEAPYAYGLLREETGIHRLVRISPFDSSHRRHTSFVAVDVIPEVEQKDLDVRDEDLKIDTFRAGGPGGQHVNVTDSAVRITHLPTGLVVQCQDQRSQHKNKAMALRILKARLYEHREMQRQRETQKRHDEKARIEWGSQVRSYVLHPYTMVKDHRTGLETGNVEAILSGKIDEFVTASLKHDKKGSTEE